MHRRSSRAVLFSTAVVTTLAGLTLVPTAAADAALGTADRSAAPRIAAAQPRTVPTPFAFFNRTYGTQVDGVDLPAGSKHTALEGIGCTNRAGVAKTNNVTTVDLPGGLGELQGVYTRGYTEKVGASVASVSVHHIARVVLAETPLGSLELTGVNSLSRASHDAKGFHATTETSLASILLRPAVGSPVEIDLPTPGRPVVVPGVARISVPRTRRSVSDNSAYATADALDVFLVPTRSRVRVAHTAARVFRGITVGTFRGSSNATEVRALDDEVRSGPNPLSLMPCAGTFGKLQRQDLARTTLAGLLDVSGAHSSQLASSTAKQATGFEAAHIARVDIGDGALVLQGITARANVTRGKRVVSNTRGTDVLSFSTNGTARSVADLDGFEIPGLLEVQTNVTRRSAHGIDVVAVRITLLDGSGAVVDLAHAELRIRPVRRG